MTLPAEPNRPLAGVTIVESYAPEAPLMLRLAGGLAGRIAADLGAGVTVLEGPAGDPLRGEAGAVFAFLGAGKRYLPSGGASADRLLRTADAAILDAGPDRPRDRLPPVVALLSPFAEDAGAAPASEFTLMALSGLLDLVGDPEREPLKLAGHQAAYAAGLAAFTGIAAALCRPATRRTVRVHVLDTLVWLNWKSLPMTLAPPPTRAGADAEWQVLRCADGWVALVYQEPDWPILRDFVGDPRLAAPDFATRAGRLGRIGEVARIIEAKFLTLTRRQLHDIALDRRLPLGPVWSPREVRAEAQSLARGFPAPVGDESAVPRLPVIWGGRTFGPGAIPAAAGEAVA
ncbi:CoA transferase [Inquilinus sp.]|uniref:CoA transferase n=1 Tax=Inquilinus sp. TaxID=1932117 RepID=UPI0031E124C6